MYIFNEEKVARLQNVVNDIFLKFCSKNLIASDSQGICSEIKSYTNQLQNLQKFINKVGSASIRLQ
jgi:hypothetical protein